MFYSDDDRKIQSLHQQIQKETILFSVCQDNLIEPVYFSLRIEDLVVDVLYWLELRLVRVFEYPGFYLMKGANLLYFQEPVQS